MIELAVVSDPVPGRRFQADAALIRVGRQLDLEVVLVESGVWGTHAEISLEARDGFVVRPSSVALVTVNGQPIQEHRLRSGDVIGLGAVCLRFSIRSAPQRSLAIREAALWALITLVALAGSLVMTQLGN